MKKKLFTALFGVLGGVALSLGAIATGNATTAQAEDNYQSVGDRYFYATSGNVESFLDKKAANSSYKGLRTELTNLTPGEDVTAYYTGLVSPVAANKAVVYYDMSNSSPDAEAFIYTYTLAKDRSRQVSIISIERNGSYYFSVALTDEIEIRDGYAYLAGTDQQTVGLTGTSADAAYTTNGFWSKNGSDLQHVVTTTGDVYISSTSIAANIKSNAFLDSASEKLAGTKYEDLYTEESVNGMISAFGSGAGNNTAILSITYKGVKRSEVAFHLRGVSGQWIGDKGGVAPWNGGNTYGFALQKTNVIYKNVPVRLDELFSLHTLYISSGAEKTNPFGVGFYNTSASGEGGTWFKIENGKGIIGGGYTAQYTPTETGRFYVKLGAYVAPNYSALGSYSPSAVFEFEVVNGDPVIESKEDVLAYKGMTYDLSAFFNVWHLGKKENTIFEFKLDGVACADGKLIADGLNHSAQLTVTDEYGNKASGVAEIRGAEIVIDEEVKITPFKGKSVALPVPFVRGNAAGRVSYSLKLKDETGKVLSTEALYTFVKDGTYSVEYTFEADGATSMVKVVRLIVEIQPLIPEIVIGGEYGAEYFTGHVLKIFKATATDETGDGYEVKATLKNGSNNVSVENDEVKLETAGAYTLTYVCEYASGKTVSVVREFSVVKDDIAPEIVVEGTYAENYERGTVIRLCGFSASDNSEEVASSGVKVYLNGNEIAVEDNMLRLSNVGKYEIVYYATDLSGNASETKFSFEVSGEEEKSGCNKGCKSALSGAVPLSALIACALVAIMRKRKSN